jgi:hypothetical protein
VYRYAHKRCVGSLLPVYAIMLGGFKFRSEHHLCSESRRGGCNGNDGS